MVFSSGHRICSNAWHDVSDLHAMFHIVTKSTTSQVFLLGPLFSIEAGVSQNVGSSPYHDYIHVHSRKFDSVLQDDASNSP